MTGRRFPEQFINEVRDRTSLVALIGRTVKLTRRGREHIGCCPFHSEKTGSFTVNEDKGFAHCFGCSWHGDAIDFVRAHYNCDFTEAVEMLAAEAGMIQEREGEPPRPKPVVQRPSREDLEAEKAQTIEWARGVWARAVPASGTIVETYLRSRRITIPAPPSLRFSPSLKHTDTGLFLPAMVAGVQAVDGRVVGVHRTFLKADGSAKAGVTSPKKMGGVCWGGAVRFARPATILRIAEGIETALSILQAMPDAAVWAALSLGNMGSIDLPEEVREVRLFADSDNKDPAKAQELLERAAERHARAGRKVSIAHAPDGMDFNDVLRGTES